MVVSEHEILQLFSSDAEANVTWLLVEDDSDIRNVVSVMMSVWGEKPLAFPDGNAAWDWLDNVSNGTFTGELPTLPQPSTEQPPSPSNGGLTG